MTILNRIVISLRHSFKYVNDGLYTVHNPSFLKNEEFIAAEKAGTSTGSWKNIQWRLHTILWASKQACNLEGDFVECGSNKGGFARAIVEYLDFQALSKSFYLIDTFNGLDLNLSQKEEIQNHKKINQHYTDCFSQVKNTFENYPHVKIIRGTIPGILSTLQIQKISFLSIDLNTSIPEIAAINYFWPKMIKGGVVVLDDYAYVTCNKQNDAFNEWAKLNNVEILSLPTGQGLIIK